MAENPNNLMQFFEFVGWFVTEFAKLEHLLRRCLRASTGLSADAFDKIMGYPRTDDATSKLRKLIPPSLSNEAKADVTSALDQLGKLSQLRNWIVHYGGHSVDDPPDHFLIRLNPKERSAETGEPYIIIPRPEAWAACADVSSAGWLLTAHLDTAIELETRQLMLEHQPQPWRYKPPRLAQSRQGRP